MLQDKKYEKIKSAERSRSLIGDEVLSLCNILHCRRSYGTTAAIRRRVSLSDGFGRRIAIVPFLPKNTQDFPLVKKPKHVFIKYLTNFLTVSSLVAMPIIEPNYHHQDHIERLVVEVVELLEDDEEDEDEFVVIL